MDRVNGVGHFGLPLPGDAAPDGNILAARGATPEVDCVLHRGRASNRWMGDLDHSRPAHGD